MRALLLILRDMIEVELIDRMEHKSAYTQKLIEMNRHQLAAEFAEYLPDLPQAALLSSTAREGGSEPSREDDMAKAKKKTKAGKKTKKARRTKKPAAQQE